MSQENVDLVREMIDAYNRRDVGFLEDRVHPDATLVTYEALGLGDVYNGPGGVRRYFEDAMAWENIQVRTEGVKEGSGGHVLFWGKLCSTGETSGLSLEVDLAWAVEVAGEKVAALRAYESRAEALEAVGLRE